MRYNELLSLSFKLELTEETDIIKIGQTLVDCGADNLTDGGFWIWNIDTNIEFYSPNFRKSLGFKNEKDFPNLSTSWQNNIHIDSLKIAVFNFDKAVKSNNKHPYTQNVIYRKKDNTDIYIECSGIVLKNKKLNVLIGSHKIIPNHPYI